MVEPLTGLFIFGLYKATEKIWEKGFDAAWEPVDEALKKRFTRWAGRARRPSVRPPSSKPLSAPAPTLCATPLLLSRPSRSSMKAPQVQNASYWPQISVGS